MRPPLRLLPLLASLTLLLGLRAGCGGGDDEIEQVGTAAAASEPYEMAEVHSRLEESGLMLQRTGLEPELPEETDEPLLDARRYEIPPSSREFELLVFSSADAADRAAGDLRETDFVDLGGSLAVSENVVAAFPRPGEDFEGYEQVRAVLSGLE